MAYDRYDPRDRSRDERSRWRDEPSGRHNERGFFERAGDEVASWFGDDDAERRRREDQRFGGHEHGSGRDLGREAGRDWRGEDHRGSQFGDRGRHDRDHDRSRSSRSFSDDDHGPFSRASYRGYGGEGGRTRSMWGTEATGGAPGVERGYEPERGGYTVSEGLNGPAQYRNRPSGFDPHYDSWRRRELDQLDQDYDEYRRERQAQFESDFGSWRERRQQKRSLLGHIREHMEVVGNDDEHVGTVDRVAGDRIILAKSDQESGGAHHSLSCSDIDRVEGDRVILGIGADRAKELWRDESRSRALFEREDQGEMGPRELNRSFEGTYR